MQAAAAQDAAAAGEPGPAFGADEFPALGGGGRPRSRAGGVGFVGGGGACSFWGLCSGCMQLHRAWSGWLQLRGRPAARMRAQAR